MVLRAVGKNANLEHKSVYFIKIEGMRRNLHKDVLHARRKHIRKNRMQKNRVGCGKLGRDKFAAVLYAERAYNPRAFARRLKNASKHMRCGGFAVRARNRDKLQFFIGVAVKGARHGRNLPSAVPRNNLHGGTAFNRSFAYHRNRAAINCLGYIPVRIVFSALVRKKQISPFHKSAVRAKPTYFNLGIAVYFIVIYTV